MSNEISITLRIHPISKNPLHPSYVAETTLGRFPIAGDPMESPDKAALNLLARINNNFDRAHLGIALLTSELDIDSGNSLSELINPKESLPELDASEDDE